jgi:hypothetical protein
MCTCEEGGVDALAGEILRYLHAHTSASDTTEGIARWWIKRQRLEDTVTRVQFALDRLVADALVEPRLTRAGQTLYLLRQAGRGGRDAGAEEGN